MPAITPLVCSACGSQLKPTSEHDRFTCPNCGTEHLVERRSTPGPASSPSLPAASPKQSAPTAKRSAANALIALFDRVPDSDALSVLLEPVNLLKLMLIYGWNEHDIKQQLTNGKIPGELLLELLDREPDANKLLAHLGQPATASQKAALPPPMGFLARLTGIISKKKV
jgi:DNA-directed RNA polymerase subunit RPC12/RpoP